MKARWLDRALVFSSHSYMLCTTEKQFHRALRKLRIPKAKWPAFTRSWHADATAHYFENQGLGMAAVVICLRNFEGKTVPQIAGLLAHEATHLWQQIREVIGESAPSAEFEAYALGNLTQQLLEEFFRQTAGKGA